MGNCEMCEATHTTSGDSRNLGLFLALLKPMDNFLNHYSFFLGIKECPLGVL